MRKIFNILFSVYILLLSCMPCTDIEPPAIDKNTAFIYEKTCNNPHEDETCSPFCICFCCGSLAENISHFPDIKIIETKHTDVFLVQDIKTKQVSFSVWQPPKMS